jgi:imidazolonepropionase-like amidohydrolase
MSYQRTLIREVNVFDGSGFNIETILLDGGRITRDVSDSAGAIVINGTAKYLVPAFIDCHIHLGENADGLAELATYGIATALDMACFPPPIWKTFERLPGTCDFRTAGAPATCAGSEHAKVFGSLLEPYFISTPEEAPNWIQKRMEEGSDYIKLVADHPIGPSQETLRALVVAARSAGKMTVVHAASKIAFEMAVRAQADFVTHAPMDQEICPDLIPLMKKSKVVVIPTLTIEESRSARFNLNYGAARQTVKLLYDSGIPILAGTDSTGVGGPAPLPYGSTLHHEFELLCDAGLTPLDVIRSTTELAAKHFGLTDRGTIEEGHRADLVLLSKNPLENIKHTRTIEKVWCAGVEVDGVKS